MVLTVGRGLSRKCPRPDRLGRRPDGRRTREYAWTERPTRPADQGASSRTAQIPASRPGRTHPRPLRLLQTRTAPLHPAPASSPPAAPAGAPVSPSTNQPPKPSLHPRRRMARGRRSPRSTTWRVRSSPRSRMRRTWRKPQLRTGGVRSGRRSRMRRTRRSPRLRTGGVPSRCRSTAKGIPSGPRSRIRGIRRSPRRRRGRRPATDPPGGLRLPQGGRLLRSIPPRTGPLAPLPWRSGSGRRISRPDDPSAGARAHPARGRSTGRSTPASRGLPADPSTPRLPWPSIGWWTPRSREPRGSPRMPRRRRRLGGRFGGWSGSGGCCLPSR
jgi:hypothetical protein